MNTIKDVLTFLKGLDIKGKIVSVIILLALLGGGGYCLVLDDDPADTEAVQVID